MSDSLPTLNIRQSQLASTSSAKLTARLYQDGSDNHAQHLPQVKSNTSRLKVKGDYARTEKLYKPKKVAEPAPSEATGTEDNACLSDSDSDASSCSSYSSSESGFDGAHISSEKTEADEFRSISLSNATRSGSQDTISDSVLPSILPFAGARDSRVFKKMQHHVASELLHHNHHILLHRGQTALNSHIQITVKAKAANEIAAHAVVTEMPALLATHRQRAHLAALEGHLHPLGAPPISSRGLSVNFPTDHGAPPLHRNTTGLMSPTSLLTSPLHTAHTHQSHGALVRTSSNHTRTSSNSGANSTSQSPSPHISLKVKTNLAK